MCFRVFAATQRSDVDSFIRRQVHFAFRNAVARARPSFLEEARGWMQREKDHPDWRAPFFEAEPLTRGESLERLREGRV